MHTLARQSPAVELIRFQPDLTDAEAIGEVVRGNREMFEVIVRRYNRQLYRVGMAYLRNHALTEDAMQNAYLKAFLNLRRFRGSAAFSTWLTRVMINECRMLLRSKKRTLMDSFDDHEAQPESESLVTPAPEPLLQQDIRAVLEQALLALPRTHRAVYLLREMQHLSTEETAQCLGLTRENVKVCLHRAREGLKAQVLKSTAGVELLDYPACYCDPLTTKVMQAVTTQRPLI